MLKPPAARRFRVATCSLVVSAAFAAPAYAQTLLQGTVATSVGATDNARSAFSNSGLGVDPGLYGVATGRLDLRHQGRVDAYALSYSLSAYKHVVPDDLSSTVTHTVDAGGIHEYGPERAAALGASFTRRQLNILTPFAGPRPAETPTTSPLPTMNGPELRQEGPLDYVSAGLRQSVTHRLTGKSLLRQGATASYFHPLDDESGRADAWTFDASGGLDHRLRPTLLGTSELRVGHSRSGHYSLAGVEVPRRTLWHAEALVGLRKELSLAWTAAGTAGAYATFSKEGSPRPGPSAHVEVTYQRAPAVLSVQYDHTVSSSAQTGETFVGDSGRVLAGMAFDRYATWRAFGTAGLQRGTRVRGNDDVPGRLLVWAAALGLQWDPEGPFRFALQGTSLYQNDKSGPSDDMLSTRRLQQAVVLFTVEATFPPPQTDLRRPSGGNVPGAVDSRPGVGLPATEGPLEGGNAPAKGPE